MTAQEKADELVGKMEKDFQYFASREIAIKHALIAVDEMIIQNGELYLNSLGDKTINFYKEKNNYLFKVKQEIEKL